MTRIAIAADLHVDDFGSKLLPSGLNARFYDALEAISFVGRTAVERGAAALVVAGDYTEAKNPAPPRVARIIERLKDGPATQIHLRGNHDSERAGKSIVNVLGEVAGWTGYTVPGIQIVDDVVVCLIPFLSQSWLRARQGLEQAPAPEVYRLLSEQYLTLARAMYAQVTEAGAENVILVGHQQLAGGRMNDTQAAFLGDNDVVIDARALASIGFKAVVFGHVHRAQTVIDDPACPVLFVGSTHRVDFAEEHEDKSFVLLDVAGGKASIERIPIPSRRFVTIRGNELGNHGDIEGAVVRVLDLPAEYNAAAVRRSLEVDDGAFEVQEIRTSPPEQTAAAGTMSESLSTDQALEAWFAEDPDREALVGLGREILEAVRA